MEWRERDGVRWLEADLGDARAAFSTPLGGISEPPFDSLNLGILTEDDPEAVKENRQRLATALRRDPEQNSFSPHAPRTPGIEPTSGAHAHPGSFFRPNTTKETPPGFPG